MWPCRATGDPATSSHTQGSCGDRQSSWKTPPHPEPGLTLPRPPGRRLSQEGHPSLPLPPMAHLHSHPPLRLKPYE